MGRLRAATESRFQKRNALKRAGRPGRVLFCATPVAERVTSDHLIEPLAEFIAGNRADGEKPPPKPKGFDEVADQLDSHELALIALTPLLNAIYGGWDGDDTDSAENRLTLKMGGYLYDKLAMKRLLYSADKKAREVGERLAKGGGRRKTDRRYLKPDWNEEDKLRAGHWLMQCAMSLSYFTLDQSGFPTIAPDWKKVFDDTREQMMLADPVILPHLAPPPEWTQWRAKYENRIGANFVRDWRPETREAITEAFAQPDFEHARGVTTCNVWP